MGICRIRLPSVGCHGCITIPIDIDPFSEDWQASGLLILHTFSRFAQRRRHSVDVYRGGDARLVKLDPAGVRADGVQLEVQGNRLHVSGHRSDLSIFDQQQACSMEISYNRFHRSVELPIDLSHVNMCREHHNRMLLVVIEQKIAE